MVLLVNMFYISIQQFIYFIGIYHGPWIQTWRNERRYILVLIILGLVDSVYLFPRDYLHLCLYTYCVCVVFVCLLLKGFTVIYTSRAFVGIQ